MEKVICTWESRMRRADCVRLNDEIANGGFQRVEHIHRGRDGTVVLHLIDSANQGGGPVPYKPSDLIEVRRKAPFLD